MSVGFSRFFLALVISIVFFRLWGPAWGSVALLTLALTYTEGGAPQWAWVAVLVGDEGYTITVGSERLSIPKQGEVYDTEALGQQLGREPTPEELGDRLSMAPDEIRETLETIRSVRPQLPCFALTNTTPIHQAAWSAAVPAFIASSSSRQ